MFVFPEHVVTDLDRDVWPCYTDGAIRGISIIHKIATNDLKSMVEDAILRNKFKDHIGPNTNPNWVLARIADELYDRSDIDESSYYDTIR